MKKQLMFFAILIGLIGFRDFPPRQKAASFSVDEVLKKLEKADNATN